MSELSDPRWRSRVRRLTGAAVSRILLGSLIGQGAILIASPALTRLYTPADFGALAVVTAVSAVLGNLVTLSWERAIVVPAEHDRAKDVVALGVLSVAILAAALTAAAYFARHEMAALLNSRVFNDFWWLVPATVAAIGFYAVASSWLVRRQRYSALAMRNAVQGLSQAGSSVVLGLIGLTPLGLTSSPAVGRIAALIGMVRLRRRETSGAQRQLRETAARYRRFPLVNTWSRMLNSLGLQLPVILIISLFGSVEAGFYALTLRVLASPVGIVADAVSQYFEGSFAKKFRDDEPGLDRMLSRLAVKLLLVGALPVVIVLAVGPWLFSLVFGAEWAIAGFYAQLLVLSYYSQFVVSPVSRALVILERQGTQLLWDASRFVATASAVVVAWALGADFAVCAIALAAVQVVWYLALFVLCRVASRSAERRQIE